MKALLAGTALLIMALPAVAGSDDPIQQRHELMEDTREALKPLVGMVKGEAEFDAAVAASSFETMQHTADTAGGLFPPGSETGGDTEARSTIWTDREGFDQALLDFANAVQAARDAAPQSVDELKPVLGAVTKTCKGCHDGYRVKDE
jgi:cytochrome c556